jgi:hypothetical protein
VDPDAAPSVRRDVERPRQRGAPGSRYRPAGAQSGSVLHV